MGFSTPGTCRRARARAQGLSLWRNFRIANTAHAYIIEISLGLSFFEKIQNTQLTAEFPNNSSIYIPREACSRAISDNESCNLHDGAQWITHAGSTARRLFNQVSIKNSITLPHTRARASSLICHALLLFSPVYFSGTQKSAFIITRASTRANNAGPGL